MNWISQRAGEAGGILVAPGVSPGIPAHFESQPSKRAAYIFSYVASFRIKTSPAKVCRPFGARFSNCAWYPGLTPGATFCRRLRRLVVAFLLTGVWSTMTPGQISRDSLVRSQTQMSLSRYLDQTNGTTADDAVAYALAHNGELQAARKEIEAARAMVKQARLKPNPKLDIGVSQNVTGTDHTIDVGGMLPLELGGRRPARIAVAEREVEIREREVANNERMLAAEVRVKFGEALAQALKLSFTDELVEANQQSSNLIAARVTEGATAPLEQNMALVELNRLRSLRESAEGKLEVLMFELRKLIGIKPADPLRLRGDFSNLVDQLPPVAEATERALRERPDLQAFRAAENLAIAQIEKARAEGRLDAS